MNLDDYKVMVALPKDILDRCIKDCLNNDFKHPYTSSRIGLNRETTRADTGPQFNMKVSQDIKLDIEKIIGVECVYASYLKSMPNFITLPHTDKDSETFRKSCLTWTLSDNTVPTIFYSVYNSVIGKYKYDQYGFILDTRIPHGAINKEHQRLMIQLMFDMEPFKLKEIIHAHISSS